MRVPVAGLAAALLTLAVGPAHAQIIFSEDFSDNGAGWTLGVEWQIGATAVSPSPQVGYPDPQFDHSVTSDNGVAGAVLGTSRSSDRAR